MENPFLALMTPFPPNVPARFEEPSYPEKSLPAGSAAAFESMLAAGG